jgi:hypothetical protein
VNENPCDPSASAVPPSGSARPHRLRARGQVLVIFVFALGALFGILALVVDIGNIWDNSLHVQAAAEAAAMAGVPSMPGDFASASTKATAEAQRNGFSAAGGATVTPAINLESNRRLDVTISRTYGTYFLRVLGMNTVRISRSATAEYTLPVPMGSPLSTYGDNSGKFWAAAMSQGADRTYGDAYGAYYNPKPTLNTQYDYRGYHYSIEIPVGAGATNIDLYDPTFCAVSANKGTGDHWIPWNLAGWPAVSTYFKLWSDPAETPLDYSDDVEVASSGDLFANQRQIDTSTTYRETGASWTTPYSGFAALPDCTADPYHNAWWTLATVVSPGTYRLQVTTTNQLNLDAQKGTSSENMWGLRAVPTYTAYTPHVFGLGKMVIYANVTSGTTLFYLGQIEAVHAGKTMVIQLFDPGDASGNSAIEILQPTATGYTAAQFSYTADANAAGSKSGTKVLSLKTTINGAAQYNNSWVTITVPLPLTYAAPLPPGEPAGVTGGWWKIRYTFDNTTSDTTTWQVSIRGNPVHLVLP